MIRNSNEAILEAAVAEAKRATEIAKNSNHIRITVIPPQMVKPLYSNNYYDNSYMHN